MCVFLITIKVNAYTCRPREQSLSNELYWLCICTKWIIWLEEMKYSLFLSSLLCICNCVTWWIIVTCKRYFFDLIIFEPVFFVLHIGEPSIATSKMSLQWSVVGKLHHSNCNVWCGDINDVCYVLSVTVCVHWFSHCIVTKSVQNLLFKIIGEYVKYYHTSKCFWLNLFESTVVQNGAFKDENYCIDHLCIVEFVNSCYITRWILYTFHLSFDRHE